ncbi:DNA methyltransferase, partial [Campylobacter sp. MIT 99-7217]
SKYCQNEALKALKDLTSNLAPISKNIVMTYNNTYNSNSSSSQNKIKLEEIKALLEEYGKTRLFKLDFKPFSAGKTEFKDHKEIIFLSELR